MTCSLTPGKVGFVALYIVAIPACVGAAIATTAYRIITRRNP